MVLDAVFEIARRDGMDKATVKTIAEELQISLSAARQLHLNKLIYTIGIGTIFSVTSTSISKN